MVLKPETTKGGLGLLCPVQALHAEDTDNLSQNETLLLQDLNENELGQYTFISPLEFWDNEYTNEPTNMDFTTTNKTMMDMISSIQSNV